MFEKHEILEITLQYEVLDIITPDIDLTVYYQRFTNTEGMIFLLDDDGKVYCFDPAGEKTLEELWNLHKD